MSFQLPSLYGPIAKLGFCRDRRVRRVFRFAICDLYRKRVWNPVINSWMKYRGFDPQRHLLNYNIHAACSAVTLLMVAIFPLMAHQAALQSLPHVEQLCYVMVAGCIVYEVVFNVPAIVLCRYLYLVTLRKPRLAGQKEG